MKFLLDIQTSVSYVRSHKKMQEKKLSAKEKLLQGAEILFAQKGLQGASVREITTKAGVHLSAVNYHFGSKT